MAGKGHHQEPAEPDVPQITVTPVQRDPALLTRLPRNARFMRKEQYDRLVSNLKADGALTSVPLIYGHGYEEGRELILSGNHRCDTSVEAGITSIWCLLIEEELPKDRLLGLQLSHNAIAGEDDLDTLAALYEEIQDVDWRAYSGLDDAGMNLLDQIDVEGLSEANLDFATMQIVFLPPELEAAREALETARTSCDQTWLAARSDYEPVLDALASVHTSHKVGNVATALGIVLAVFENHLTDLQDGWLDPDTAELRHQGTTGLETVIGVRTVPVATADSLLRCLRRAQKTGEVGPDELWRVIDVVCAAYLEQLDKLER